MAYQTRSISFDDFVAILEAENKFAYNMLFDHLKKNYDDLWFAICFNSTPEDDARLLEVSKTWIAGIDSGLYSAVMDRAGDRNTHLEVAAHFSQDKSELELWQEFDTACEGDAFQDKLDLYRNEY